MEAVNIENLTFKYPLGERDALTNINLKINSSEFIVLCGKSGCGKSTLLKHLKKNLMPYGQREGEILYYGNDIEDLDDRTNASEIGFVQQNPDNQIVTDKVWHELAFGLESLGLDNYSIKSRVAEMASYFDIQGWFRKSVDQLSGGQKQLLNLASIMAMQPKILVLDEPTSQLDPIAAADFLQTIYKINRDLGTTIIISEHRLEELIPMADKVIVMDDSRIIAYDDPEKIGRFLAGNNEDDMHPMFYGMPSVVRIFNKMDRNMNSPLTIREGRIWIENNVKATKVKFNKVLNKKTQDNNNNIINIQNLWFRYDKNSGDVLRGLELKVKDGEWFCLLGGNGSGKSTTLKAIANIIKPQRGKVLIEKRLAMVPQNPQSLFTEITVMEELLEALHFIRLSDKEKSDKVKNMLKLLEIEHLIKANPYDLSGGEQQRLALGKILLLEPQILLLDEPTKGLDPFFKRTLAGILRNLVNKGVTIFMVSHDIEFCAEYADRCGMFFDGNIVSSGTPREFFSGNNFYTTTANKIGRDWIPEAITCEEVSEWLKTVI